MITSRVCTRKENGMTRRCTLCVLCTFVLNVCLESTATLTRSVVTNGHVVVEEIWRGDGKLEECFVYDKRFFSEKNLQVVDDDVVKMKVTSCHESQLDHDVILESYKKHRKKRSFFIYPGTKWCGVGKIATSRDDLGRYVEADRCCRDHDYCGGGIDGWTRKYGLFNASPFYRSSCACDSRFYTCLKNAKHKVANYLGQIYFNILNMKCLSKDFPSVCTRKGWFWTCKKRSPDFSRPKIWKFVDNKKFK